MKFSFTVLTAGKESEAADSAMRTVEALARRHYLEVELLSSTSSTHTWQIEGTTQHYAEFAAVADRMHGIVVVESASSPWK